MASKSPENELEREFFRAWFLKMLSATYVAAMAGWRRCFLNEFLACGGHSTAIGLCLFAALRLHYTRPGKIISRNVRSF
jgi:hypothetical protein